MSSADGQRDLATLIANMAPELATGEFVFCTFAAGSPEEFARLSPLATFQEAEGLSLVLSRETAEGEGLAYQGVMRCISLTVHSSLDAVGLTAAVASALAEEGISANVVAAYYHDHIFVPVERAQEALTLLRRLGS